MKRFSLLVTSEFTLNTKIMKKQIIIITSILVVLAVVFISANSKSSTVIENSVDEQNYTMLCTNVDDISSNIPSDVLILNQYCANTFAWESFLALNWPAAKKSGGGYIDGKAADVPFTEVGKPGDLSPTVWETYADINAFMGQDSASNWEDNQILPLEPGETCETGRVFKHFNKLTSPQEQDIQDLFQASGPQWLVGQNEKVVWYEILTNEVEFDFIMKNKLFNNKGLKDYVDKNGDIWLPERSMELKASWLQLSDEEGQSDQFKNRYKIIQGCVPQKVELVKVGNNWKTKLSDFQPTYLALIGLHIITKSASAPQFTWATFEHVDNVPTEYAVDPSARYMFYNQSCESTCQVNTPYPAVPGHIKTSPPNQTIRLKMNSIGKDAKSLNANVKAKIINENPGSVWQYYQLVNVQWPNTAVNQALNGQDGSSGLEYGGGYPTVSVLGNPVSETYVQQISCLNCHHAAGVSVKQAGGATKDYNSDYSFVFEKVDDD